MIFLYTSIPCNAIQYEITEYVSKIIIYLLIFNLFMCILRVGPPFIVIGYTTTGKMIWAGCCSSRDANLMEKKLVFVVRYFLDLCKYGGYNQSVM